MRHIIDIGMGKLASRKLWAWLVATALALAGAVTSGDWVTVTVVYIGTQAAVDIAAQLQEP